VYSCTGVLLYTAEVIVCTAVLVYCYTQHSKLCVQLYWFTVIYNTWNCVHNCTGVLLYTAQEIVFTAVLVYSYIQQRQ
jgi:hypothetical protein